MASEDYNIMMIKGKRSKRQRQLVSSSSSSSLALTMATAASSPSTSSSDNSPAHLNIGDKSSTRVEQDMANCLILLAQGHQSQKSPASNNYIDHAIRDLYMYQCKTCDRSFPSFQALGGHRASHKRPKAAAAADVEPSADNQHQTSSLYNPDTSICTTNTILSLQISSSMSDSCGIKIGKNKSSSNKVHECSICGAEFTSGQALGGHMRRHRSILPPRATMPSHNHDADELKKPLTNVFSLDLNLPAPSEDTESKFPFTYNEQVMVFSTSALVDCHH